MPKKLLNVFVTILLAASFTPLAGQAQPAAAAALDDSSLIYLPLLTHDYTQGQTGAVTGKIVDATQQDIPIASAKVCVDGVHCVYSQEDGSFLLGDIPNDSARDLTVTPATDDYVDYVQTIQVTHDHPLLSLVISLSPANLPAGWMRIVLTWQVEGDLDAHLWVNGQDIYWNKPGSCQDVCLQNDNTHFGPETIMVRGGFDGTLSFAVTRSGDLEVTQFKALVQVYDEFGLATSFVSQEFNPPTSGYGSWWWVFDLTWDATSYQYNLNPRDELHNYPPKPL